MDGLLTSKEKLVYQKAKRLEGVKTFKDLADVDVGIVTGANNFFLVPDETVKNYGLEKYAKPMFGRSSHVKGMRITKADIEKNRQEGLPVNFLEFSDLPKSSFPKKVQKYIELGEEQKLHERYKCRIRSPWYKVPSLWSSEIFMLKRLMTCTD